MLLVLAAVLALIAAIAWLVVVYSVVRVVGLVPAGKRWNAVALMGRWRFAQVRHLGGDAVIPHANLYLKATMAFLGVLACGVAIGAAVFIDSQNSSPDQPAISSTP